MATITVRGLSPEIHQALIDRAKRNGRSMEAEVREILCDQVRPDIQTPNVLVAFREACRELHMDLPLPERIYDPPRETF